MAIGDLGIADKDIVDIDPYHGAVGAGAGKEVLAIVDLDGIDRGRRHGLESIDALLQGVDIADHVFGWRRRFGGRDLCLIGRFRFRGGRCRFRHGRRRAGEGGGPFRRDGRLVDRIDRFLRLVGGRDRNRSGRLRRRGGLGFGLGGFGRLHYRRRRSRRLRHFGLGDGCRRLRQTLQDLARLARGRGDDQRLALAILIDGDDEGLVERLARGGIDHGQFIAAGR